MTLTILIPLFIASFILHNLFYFSFMGNIFGIKSSKLKTFMFGLVTGLVGASLLIYFASMSALGYSIMLTVFTIAVMAFFKNQSRLSKVACLLSFNIHIMVARALVAATGSIITGYSIYELSINPISFWIVLILTTVASTIITVLTAIIIPKKYLNQLATKNEYLYFYIATTAFANIYMIANGNIYIHNIEYQWLALHQIIASVTWIFSTYVVSIMLGVSNSVKERKENLEKDSIYKHMVESKSLAVINVNCTKDTVVRLVIDGEKSSLPNIPYSEYARLTQYKIKHIDKESLLEKTRSPQMLIDEYKKGNTLIEYTSSQEIAGKSRWVHTTITLTKEIETNDILAVFTLNDEIHDIKVSESALKEEAERDPLVPIYNKKATEYYIRDHLAQHKRGALFMIDLDNFKAINDNFGHSYGDNVIKEVSEKIVQKFRSDDIIGRVGGDEFIVFYKNNTDLHKIEIRAKQLLREIQKTYTQNNISIGISCSIGITLSQDNDTFENLYRLADSAMYECKHKSKNGYVINTNSTTL